MILISLILVLYIQWAYFRNRPIHDPIWMIFLIYLYYTYFTPVMMYLSNDYQIYLIDIPITLTDSDYYRTSLANFLGFLGLTVGYTAAQYLWAPIDFLKPIPVKSSESSIPLVICASCAGLIFIISSFYSQDILSVLGGYDSKIETNYNSSIFSYLMSILLLFASFLSSYLIINTNRPMPISFIWISIFIILSFLTYTKQPFIFAAICVFCALSHYRTISPLVSMAWIFGISLLSLFFVIPMFASYRGTNEIDFSVSIGASSTVISSDALGPFGVTIYAFADYVQVTGHPLWQSFILWIPRSIWSSRPLDLAEDFARTMISDWQPGYGMAFSPLAEAYARGGWAMIPLFLALCGGTIACLSQLVAKIMPSKAKIPALVTLGGTLCLATLRGAYSGLITYGLQIAIPLIIIGLIASNIDQRRARTSSF
jgi:hypothetical protein